MLVVTNYKKLVINYSGSVNRTMNKKARNKVNNDNSTTYFIYELKIMIKKRKLIAMLHRG